MRQAAFEALYEERWQHFARLLERADRVRVWPGGGGERAGSSPESELEPFPELYRQVCRDLALARGRRYGPQLIERLNTLALEGHRHLYRREPGFGRAAVDFFVEGFPRRVREEWRLVLLSAALFVGPALALHVAVSSAPELLYSVLSADSVAGFEAMYDPANERIGSERAAATDLRMFGYYVWNNVSIGFRTFAGGILLGLGTVAALVFNGVLLGALSAHMVALGFFDQTFLPFVIGHGSFELTAIVLAGAAGLRLGAAVVAPGPESRARALRDAAARAVPLVYGVGAMLGIAAVIEAFWSSKTSLPLGLKIGVGIASWVFVGLYFVAGRWPRKGRRAA